MQEIITLAQSMKNKIIDTLIPVAQIQREQMSKVTNQPMKPPTYASVAKSTQKSTIIIKPSESDDTDAVQKIEEKVCKHLHNQKITATIHEVQQTTKGNVVLKLSGSDDVQSIAKSLTTVGVNAKAKALLLPKMTLTRFPSYENADPDTIRNTMISSNPWLKLREDSLLKILFSYNNKDTINVVCKMTPDIRQQIFEHDCKIKIGVRVCPMFDRFHIPICSKCSSLGHKTSDCTQTKSTCCFCSAADHATQNCTHKSDKKTHRCSNCLKSQTNVDSASSHSAYDRTCPTYLAHKKQLIKVTNWGSGPTPLV